MNIRESFVFLQFLFGILGFDVLPIGLRSTSSHFDQTSLGSNCPLAYLEGSRGLCKPMQYKRLRQCRRATRGNGEISSLIKIKNCGEFTKDSPNRFSVGVLAVLSQSSWYSLKLATRAPPRSPPRGLHRRKCPTPGSQDSTDRAKGHSGSKKYEKIQVLRMGFSIMHKLSGPQESIFSLFRSPQLNSRYKS